MTKMLSRHVVMVLSCMVMGCGLDSSEERVSGAQDQKTNPDAQVLKDFKNRVDNYVELRMELKKLTPPLKQTKDAAEIDAAQASLANELQLARETAKRGDIFSPEVTLLFRKLMSPKMKGQEGKEAKEVMKEDTPKGVPIKINAKYPESAPLPTVPPGLLSALPKLPEDLEYRFIDKDLILLDTQANLIVDYIPNAIR